VSQNHIGDDMQPVEALKKILLFRDVPEKYVGKLATIAAEAALEPRTELFHEGQELTELYVIVLGSVRVLKKDTSGDREELTTLGTGSYFGEVEFAQSDRHAAATIETIERTTVLSLPFAKIEKLCADDKELAVHVYRSIARGLALRLANTDETAANYRRVAITRRS
jgi:CRP/FNR family transcriptional regulator, cyclic AMP receptor protein